MKQTHQLSNLTGLKNCRTALILYLWLRKFGIESVNEASFGPKQQMSNMFYDTAVYILALMAILC